MYSLKTVERCALKHCFGCAVCDREAFTLDDLEAFKQRERKLVEKMNKLEKEQKGGGHE